MCDATEKKMISENWKIQYMGKSMVSNVTFFGYLT